VGLLRNWSELLAAQRVGIDVRPIARRFQIDWTQPLRELTAGLGEDEMESFAARVADAAGAVVDARRSLRGSSVWGPLEPMVEREPVEPGYDANASLEGL
jgi:hypothetical protein